MSVLIGLWMGVAARACEVDTLVAALDAAEGSLAELDPGSFEPSMERLQVALDCLDEPLTPALAARVHRAIGMRAFAARGPITAGAFAAARRIEPEPPLSEVLLPPNSPVSEAWSAMSLDGLRIRTLPAPATGWLVLDGTPSVARAVDLPVVFQRVEPDGSVSMSTYLLPGDSTPAYPIRGPSATGPAIGAPPVATRADRGPRTAFAVTALASSAAAAGLWALSADARGRYFDLEHPVPDDRLNALQTRTNALTVGSIVSAGLCATSSVLLVKSW
jgi:hypothetical protein